MVRAVPEAGISLGPKGRGAARLRGTAQSRFRFERLAALWGPPDLQFSESPLGMCALTSPADGTGPHRRPASQPSGLSMGRRPSYAGAATAKSMGHPTSRIQRRRYESRPPSTCLVGPGEAHQDLGALGQVTVCRHRAPSPATLPTVSAITWCPTTWAARNAARSRVPLRWSRPSQSRARSAVPTRP